MPPKFLRPLLIVEFLIALQAVFTFWSQVGGQYHLDLMFWPWKFGIGMAASFLITGITAALIRSDGAMKGRSWFLVTLLVATIAVAGIVTYYYHVNEPADQDEQTDQTTISALARNVLTS
jgi:glucan phosphoethanolaminetransferase (alkaline phosphatase superfamily)